MGLTTKKLQSQIVTTESPYIYEVRDEDGNRYRHCGSMVDVKRILERYPRYTYHKIYLKTPQTVDVPYVRVSPDLELPMQQSLPENQPQPLEL
jgi:hypothetical protein